MGWQNLFKHSPLIKGIGGEYRRIEVRVLRGRAKSAAADYVASHPVRKLQLGAGPTQQAGWLVSDVDTSLGPEIVYLDATKPFPIADATFDYVFSEHMIEHIPHGAGESMLRECHRILRPGGRVRIGTPDLDVLLALKREPLDARQAEYVSWIVKSFLEKGTPAEAVFVINNQFRNYGHQFLYDERTLRRAMEDAGFADIRRVPVGESDDPNLRGIESHGANVENQAMNAFETMVLEAKRP